MIIWLYPFYVVVKPGNMYSMIIWLFVLQPGNEPPGIATIQAPWVHKPILVIACMDASRVYRYI